MPVQQDDINDVVLGREGWLVWEDGFWTDKMRRKTCMAHKGTEDHTIYTTTVHSIGNSRKPMDWDDRKVTPEMGPPNDSGVPQRNMGRAQHGNPGKQAQFHLWDSVADEANALTTVRLLFLCEGDGPYHSSSSFLYHSWLFLELSFERSWFLKRAVSSKTTFIK